MSASSSSTKKIKQMSVDRLSALPDAILCYILSFLEMKEAAITCLLSKRWQFLWTQLPALRFDDRMAGGMEEIRKFVSRVHKTLVICSRYNLERLEVDFVSSYEQYFASDVDVWIGFAVENKVKIFKLLVSGTMGHSHGLPQMMYSNPSWTSLTLQGCFMYPRGTIQWPSLTTLFIEDVDLSEHTFRKIFTGCPVLSSLDLVICRGFDRLEVSSTSLLRLAIQDEDHGFSNVGELEISAPHLHSLKIEWHTKYERLCVENIESLVRAEIEIDDEWEGCHPKIGRNSIKQLFVSTRHVKMLKLGPRCLQFLSLITSKWQLPQSTRRCLELHAYRGNRGIHGIVTLLKSSPSLETLVIRVDEHYGQV